MADTKITALAAIGANPINVATFPIPMVDLLDTSMAASGTTKKVTVNQILGAGGTATLASATITGDLTVRTNTISATSSGVGFGITTAAAAIDVVSSFQWRSNVAGADKLAMFSGGAGLIYLGSTTASALGFLYNGSTAMTLNSTGLGVGGSPSYKLDVSGDLAVNGNENYVYLFSNYNVGSNARVRFRAVGAGGGSGYGGDFRISTRAANNAWNTDVLVVDNSGNLLVGKSSSVATAVGIQFQPLGTSYHTLSASTNAEATLLVYSTDAAAYRFYVGLGGTVFATNTTISAISDARLKENVQDLDVGLDAILALKPRKFDWKAGKGKDIKGDRGFIAQEFEQVFPNLIDEWKDPAPEGEAPYKSVRQDLIPVLVKAIQELTARVEALEA
jgi:hypothetical protein